MFLVENNNLGLCVMFRSDGPYLLHSIDPIVVAVKCGPIINGVGHCNFDYRNYRENHKYYIGKSNNLKCTSSSRVTGVSSYGTLLKNSDLSKDQFYKPYHIEDIERIEKWMKEFNLKDCDNICIFLYKDVCFFDGLNPYNIIGGGIRNKKNLILTKGDNFTSFYGDDWLTLTPGFYAVVSDFIDEEEKRMILYNNEIFQFKIRCRDDEKVSIEIKEATEYNINMKLLTMELSDVKSQITLIIKDPEGHEEKLGRLIVRKSELIKLITPLKHVPNTVPKIVYVLTNRINMNGEQYTKLDLSQWKS